MAGGKPVRAPPRHAAGQAPAGAAIERPQQATDSRLCDAVLGGGLFLDKAHGDDLVAAPLVREGEEICHGGFVKRSELFCGCAHGGEHAAGSMATRSRAR